jgi:hypothetical protein
MTLSLPAKRLLAGIASAFLLLCQTAMATQAWGLVPAVAGESTLSDRCHGVGPQTGDASGHALQQTCPAEYASASFAKLDIPQDAELPALAPDPGWLRARARDDLISGMLPARAEPPPLSILHCCLRI